MHKKPAICNGQSTGHPCKHYWHHIQKVESNDPDALKDGEKHRTCLISPGFPVEFSDEEIPHACNQYQARRKPGILGLLGCKVKYDPSQEEYCPLSPEEIAALRAQDPATDPEPGFFFQTAGMSSSLPIVEQDVPDTAPTAAQLEAFISTFRKDNE